MNFFFIASEPDIFAAENSVDSDQQKKLVNQNPHCFECSTQLNEGLDGGVWYSLFIKNLAHYSSH